MTDVLRIFAIKLETYFIYNEEDDAPDYNLTISALLNAVKILSNYMASNNVSLKISF